MSYDSRFTGEIKIEPPLSWGQIQSGPELMDLRLRTVENTIHTEQGSSAVINAVAVAPLTLGTYAGYRIVEDLQALVDSYPGHRFVGHISAAYEEDGTQWRVAVVDGKAVRIDARVVWPGDDPAETVLARVRQVRAALAWEAANGCGFRRHGIESAVRHLDEALTGGEQELPDAAGITPIVASHVLHHFGEPGYGPGSFTASLIHTLACADVVNKARLAERFPGYAAAVLLAQDTDGGVTRLKHIAGRAA